MSCLLAPPVAAAALPEVCRVEKLQVRDITQFCWL